MSIGHLHFDKGFFGSVASLGASRVGSVLGAHWAFAVRTLDFIYALSVFGVLGGVPLLLKILAKYARYAMTRWQ
jgi:hypothetical protein